MNITLKLNTDNAAFEDNPEEIRRIIGNCAIAAMTMEDGDSYPLHDINGNKVGYIKAEED
jgi:hypothetical protein